MKKLGIVGLALTLALVGCGGTTAQDTSQEAETSTQEEPSRLDPGTANSIITGDKWQYIYPGDDPVMAAITNEMCRMATQRFEIKDGIFPAVEVVRQQERDGVTEVYTLAEIDSYELQGTVLKLQAGSSIPTRFDLKAEADGSYTVASYTEAEDGEGWADSIKAMCHDDEELAQQMTAKLMHLQTRLGFIRDYIAAYKLDVSGLVASDDGYVDLNTTEEPVDEDAEAAKRAEEERKAAERKAAEAKAAQEKAEAEAKVAQEKAAEEKAAQEKAEAERKAAERAAAELKAQQEKAEAEAKVQAEKAAEEKAAAEEKQEQETESHTEGESVTIDIQNGDDVYANWHKDDDGKWWATFWTYNYTEIYADLLPDGGWLFYALDNGELVQVVHSDEESSDYGKYGPQGVDSHWVSIDNTTWY